MPPYSRPVADPLEAQPPLRRLSVRNGALLDETHFSDEQLYVRGQLARLALFTGGAGTLAGLDVAYDPPAGGADVEVTVKAGLAIDRLGRIIEIPFKSCLPLGAWLADKQTSAAGLAEVQAGDRAAAGPLPRRVVVDVTAAFRACAREPEPAFATGNADAIDGVMPSRILDAARLELVIRPDGDDREPSSLAAARLADPVSADDVKTFKRTEAYALTRAEEAPFSLPAGGALSEHIVAGNVQDGSEILLARLVIPLVEQDGTLAFDDTIDLTQDAFAPDQTIRPYSYSAAELALLAGVRR